MLEPGILETRSDWMFIFQSHVTFFDLCDFGRMTSTSSESAAKTQPASQSWMSLMLGRHL
jgi:hypothetical protein